ncbi:MAG TPA: D-alanyl-D-alanine carboxypeptidase [Salinimicrobium sp.]|nr:D-alanyl-D-alanine carboxypeptidase [Salinimicrobium sp.]
MASCSSTRNLKKEIGHTFENFDAFQPGFSGFVLYDPATREVIYEHNGSKYFTPASNTKLFTFYTGLQVLGDSIPALKYVVRNDSLYFWGTGDPTFLHEGYSYSRVYEFLKDRPEQLVYVPPVFEEEAFGPGWAWDDYNWYYSRERSAFPIYGNGIKFVFWPRDSVPQIYPGYFQESTLRDTSITGNNSLVLRDLSKNHFVFQHQKGNGKEEQLVPFKTSPELLVNMLSDTLNKKVLLLKNPPEYLSPKKMLYSVPADSLYQPMLQNSNNFFAEQILLMSSKILSDTLKSKIAIDYMKEHYLKDLPDEPIWVDGSGLSVYNKFTPRTMVKLLEKIKNEVPRERLFKLLPAGGVSGTIKNLYTAEEPYIFAKTGTLSNAHMLSGFLRTKEGKILIFSFMNNNYTVPTSRIKDGMEKILRNIYLNY